MKNTLSFILLSLLATIFIGCSSHYQYIDGKLNITVTTNLLEDMVKQIGGTNVAVHTLMGAGVDPHQYVSKPSDFTALNQADMIVVNGLHLEGKMVQVFEEGYQGKKPVILIGDEIIKSDLTYLTDEGTLELVKSKVIEDENFAGNFDPHIWFDLDLWRAGAKILTHEIIKLLKYESIKDEILKNSLAYDQELANLDQVIKNKVSQLGKNQKVLVTAHDAFQYLGREYGFEVDAMQGLSTQAEISQSSIARLVDMLITKKVHWVFAETSVATVTIQAVIEACGAKGHNVNFPQSALYSDSIGDVSGEDDTFILMYQKNIDIIVDALVRGEKND